MAKIGKVEKVTKMLKMSIFFNISQEEFKKEWIFKQQLS